MIVLGAFAVIVAASGCAGSSGSASETPSTSTTPGPGSAQITTFDVPASLQCGSNTSTTFTVTYATAGAAKQNLLVDGRPTPLTDASGAVNVPVHCDNLPHTVVLYLTDSKGRATSQQKLLTTVQG
jgi:hypothetical protein